MLVILDRLLRRIARRIATLADADTFDENAHPDVLAQVHPSCSRVCARSIGQRLTITHLVACAAAQAMRELPVYRRLRQ